MTDSKLITAIREAIELHVDPSEIDVYSVYETLAYADDEGLPEDFQDIDYLSELIRVEINKLNVAVTWDD